MKKDIFFIIFLFTLTSCCFSDSGSTIESMLSKIENQYFEYEKLGQIQEITKLFHYPQNASKESKNADAEGIAFFINLVNKEFGQITQQQLVEIEELSNGLSYGAATNDYWKDHKDFVRRIYKVTYTKVGSGYLLFDFCNISNKWEIGFVRYHLPENNENARLMLKNMYGVLLQRLKANLDSKSPDS